MPANTPTIVLLGKNGQLGWEFNRCLQPLGRVIALDWPEVDFSQPDRLADQVRALKPALIINAAAYTNVDKAESEPELCGLINHQAPAALAQTAQELRAGIVHISTDYVFDGSKGSPYLESDTANPVNTYAHTKLAGEVGVRNASQAYWIARTAWLYSLRQNDFVRRVLEWSRQKETLQVVDDQIGSPTWARMLAQILTLALAAGRQDFYAHLASTAGVYHLAGDGQVSRLGWVEKILALDPRREEQKATRVLPAKTEQFPTPAARPLYTALDCGKFESVFGLRMPPWDQALALAMSGLF